MCSIAGFFNPNIIPDQEKSRRILTAMNKCQCHRGPDEEDIIQAGGCGMAHTRLSIRDISRGHQPMKINKNGNNYYIVYNGEIYNHKELKNKLTSRGYSFNTTCDTEVLLNTFICFGPDYFENVNGIFSCAIYDESEKNVYLFKDHFGVKPLFYTISKGTLIWGSEIKALFCYPEISPEIDDESLRELTGLGPAKLNYSGVFKNIHAVKPGHYIKYSKKGFLEAPFFTLKTRYHSDTYNETVEHTGYLVKDAILKQIVSDVPICTFLSGGLDSSIVSAVCADKLKENGQQLSTFSFEFAENDKYFKSNSFQPTLDKDYAALMAVDLDTDHRILTITYEETLNALYESVLSRDLPTMADVDSSLLLFCRQVSEPVNKLIDKEKAMRFMNSTMDYGRPWYGQLMAGPQLIAYYIQINYWLKKYDVNII